MQLSGQPGFREAKEVREHSRNGKGGPGPAVQKTCFIWMRRS